MKTENVLRLDMDYIEQQKQLLGLNDWRLAKKMKATPQWVSLLFKRAREGKGIHFKSLWKLASALECKQKDLLI